MEFWRRVHWFATSKCNQRCSFCFKPNYDDEGDAAKAEAVANALVDGRVREVIFGGGEPLLRKDLEHLLSILSSNGIITSIHTNGLLLNGERLERLSAIVDDIALPVDSMHPQTQEYLRSEEHLREFKRAFLALQAKPIKLGIHTVATALNMSHIPAIYRFLRQNRFDYWKIYEFNPTLVADRFDSPKRFTEIRNLEGESATEQDGGVNTLLAKFLLLEETMRKYGDKRINFIGMRDADRAPYLFVNSSGDVSYCNYFVQGKRAELGNILREGFARVKKRIVEADRKGPLFDERAFIDALNDMPFWARYAWEGNYFIEEAEALSPRYHKRVLHLASLYFNRLKHQGVIPKKERFAVA